MSAKPFVPESRELTRLKEAVSDCRGCPLYENATQAVFGEGPETAEVVLLGEKPGDREDRTGQPFVGPAGRLLDKAFPVGFSPRPPCSPWFYRCVSSVVNLTNPQTPAACYNRGFSVLRCER